MIYITFQPRGKSYYKLFQSKLCSLLGYIPSQGDETLKRQIMSCFDCVQTVVWNLFVKVSRLIVLVCC